MSTKTYRKLQVTKIGDNFRQTTVIREFPLTDPEADQLRIRVIYTGINMTDVYFITGQYFDVNSPPFDLGMESIGVIDAIGSSVLTNQFVLNQPVLVMDTTVFDAFSEVLYKEPKYFFPLPSLKPEYLVAYFSGLTASIGLDIAGRLKDGDKVLIVAAAGGTGQMAVKWAKHKGCYVIGTTSSEDKEHFLKEIRTDLVINYRKQNLDQILREKFPNGIDVIWETVGGDSLKLLFDHLANRGRMTVIGSSFSYKNDGIADVSIPDWNKKLLRGSKSLTGFLILEYQELFQEYLEQLISMIDNGNVKAAIDMGEKTNEGKFIGLDSIARAEEYLQKGKNLGKVIVQIQNI